MALICCFIFFGMVFFKKGDSAKASLHYFTLFHRFGAICKVVIYTFVHHNLTSVKCQLSTFEGHKAYSSVYYNMFTVLYCLLPLVSEVVKCLGYARC